MVGYQAPGLSDNGGIPRDKFYINKGIATLASLARNDNGSPYHF